MSKRNLAAFLWFLVGWSGAGMLAEFAGAPSLLAVVPGVVLGLLVHWDPTHALWTRSLPKPVVRPINELAAELDGQAAAPAAEQRIAR